MGKWKDLLVDQQEWQERLDQMSERAEEARYALAQTIGGGPGDDGVRHPGFVVHDQVELEDRTYIRVDGPGAETGGSTIWFKLGAVDRVYMNIRKNLPAWEAYLNDVDKYLPDWREPWEVTSSGDLYGGWVRHQVQDWQAARARRTRRA